MANFVVCGVFSMVGTLVQVGNVGFSGTIHKFVLVHLFPHQTRLILYLTLTPVLNLVKVISHPALHRLTSEIRDQEASPGTI